MASRSTTQLLFDALSIEGGLLPPEWLTKVAALDAPAQKAADYDIPKGLELRDEITRYWRIAQALYREYLTSRIHARDEAQSATLAFVRNILSQVFGFTDLQDGSSHEIHNRRFPISLEAIGGHVPIIAGVPSESLDAPSIRHGDGGKRRSAWGLLQDYLNANDDALWGIAANGNRLRVGRDNTSLTRPAWIEADLERIFAEERFADFSVLWLVLHASRFGHASVSVGECPLELWREEARKEGTRAREQLRDGVEAALLSLGSGFLEHFSNDALRASLNSGEVTPAAYFNELLRLVYRMIFLLTIEERDILHEAGVSSDIRALYAQGYGMRRLRERAVRRSQYDGHSDLWASLKPVFVGLGRREGEPALGLPELGGLFSPSQCSHLDRSELSNSALLNAVFRLAWLRNGNTLARVNWKDMGPEELGSVYEALLELVPVITNGNRRFDFAGTAESAGNERKLTGSYYTPDSLVQRLLDSALEPVVQARLAANSHDSESAILSMTVIDPACGSGHFLLAASRRLATRLAAVRTDGTPGAQDYRLALRDVATHCIHGVDRNPMALELARMALWLETYTPERALGFFDHHLMLGDSLLGLLDLKTIVDGIPEEAFKPLTGDDKEVARVLKKVNAAALKQLKQRDKRQVELDLADLDMSAAFAQLDALNDDHLVTVEAKRTAFEKLRADAYTSGAALAADMLVGAFLLEKRLPVNERALTESAAMQYFPTTGTMLNALEGVIGASHPAAKTARGAAVRAHVLHWPLAFPQVFARGGFDVVLGNPPWERLKLSEQEFFAARDPAIARARNKADRDVRIKALAHAPEASPERRLYDDFVRAKHEAEATSTFCHTEARYPLTGVGDVNTYALFAETVARITRTSGRAGIIVPTGIATDDSTKDFFATLSQGRLVSLIDFRTGPGLFPDIGHQRYKFCLLTIGDASETEFAFSLTSVEQLGDRRRFFGLTPSDFKLLNPNTLTCPTFRTERDAEITKKIYSNAAILVNESLPPDDGNPWGLSFLRMFDMSNDSHRFADAPSNDSVPLYEAKMIHHFDHRWRTYPAGTSGDDDSREVVNVEKADPAFTPRPRYWVSKEELMERLRRVQWTRGWLLGWRGITNATNERSVIAGAFPLSAAGNSLPVLVPTEYTGDYRDIALLVANLSVLVFDYAARQKIANPNLNMFILKQLPILRPTDYSDFDRQFIIPRVAELTYTAHDMAAWAADLGCATDPYAWDIPRRLKLRAELDAYYAHLYGLTREELMYVLDPADVMGPDYPTETFRVLQQNEVREFGEYRTRRMVLEAWDELASAGWCPPQRDPNIKSNAIAH